MAARRRLHDEALPHCLSGGAGPPARPALVRGTGEPRRPGHPAQTLEANVTAIIHEIGVPAHIKGYQYLREAIIMTVEDMDVINAVTKGPRVLRSRKFCTTSPGGACHPPRHRGGLGPGRPGHPLQKYFGFTVSNSKGKPTNSEFIAMIADRLVYYAARAETRPLGTLPSFR